MRGGKQGLHAGLPDPVTRHFQYAKVAHRLRFGESPEAVVLR